MRVHLCDIDLERSGAGSPAANGRRRAFDYIEHAPETGTRRWRPALLMGSGVPDMLESYFTWPAPLPWAGLVRAEDALVTVDGLVIAGDSILLGKSLMYPVVSFPYPETPIVGRDVGNGEWEIDLPAVVRHLPGLTCNIGSPGLSIYGHWLVDALPRLHRAMHSGLEFDHFLLPVPPKPWQADLLTALGVPAEKIVYANCAEEVIRCDTVVVPTFDRFNSEVRHDLIAVHRAIVARYASDVMEQEAERKIFVTRGGWGGARLLMEREEIERRFEAAGFEIVRPETMTFIDQVRLFAGAKIVAGECGSGLHNALFCRPTTRVAIMQGAQNVNYLQPQIAHVADHEAWLLIGRALPDDGPVERFTIDVQSVDLFLSYLLER